MSKGQSEAVSERVAETLARRILLGELAPGTRIKQDELAAELKTSRIPVRDALRILESRGLVTMRANTGARVASLARADLIAAFDIRERLEPLLLARSLANFTPEDVRDLQALCSDGHDEDGPIDFLEHARSFHDLTYRRHDSAFLAAMVDRVWDAVQSYVLLAWGAMDREDARAAAIDHLREHRVLLDAIVRGEVETAQAALVMHIRRIRATVLGAEILLREPV